MSSVAGVSPAQFGQYVDPTQPQGRSSPQGGKALPPDDANLVQKLKEEDHRVRSHEAAHQAAAGGLARGGSFTYETGPDGQRYAVGGEVSIDTSPVDGKPQATMMKMQQVQRAALAPADPSPQDRRVAAQAAAVEAKARGELLAQSTHPAIKAYKRTPPTSKLGVLYL